MSMMKLQLAGIINFYLMRSNLGEKIHCHSPLTVSQFLLLLLLLPIL